MPLSINLQGDDALPNNPLKEIVKSAITFIQLDSAPTTAGNQLPKNLDAGFFGDNLFINLNGTVRRFNGTAV